MKRSIHPFSLCWVLALGLVVSPWVGNGSASAQETQGITVRFAAQVGEQEFTCGESYSGLGQNESKVIPTDFRFYVSDLALIDASGEVVPVELEQDGKWQYETVALLDFEDKSGPCGNGTEEIRNRVVGKIPVGEYQGLQFTLGVPFELNHNDVTLASSPLNLTSLWWNWQGGYKFIRVDMETPMAMMEMEMEEEGQEQGSTHGGAHGSAHGEHGGAHGQADGFLIHLGSTGCQVPEGEQQPTDCANPNRALITFETFDPETDVVIADLSALVSETDLSSNQPDTAPGCMSGPEDQDCAGLFANFGLEEGAQSFFRAGTVE